MTDVTISIYREAADGTDVLVKGVLKFKPFARRVESGAVTVPEPFSVRLDGITAPTVSLDPTGDNWCWMVDENVPSGAKGWRYLAVPDSVTALEYGALSEVDPETFAPLPSVPTVGEALAALEAEVDAKANTADLGTAAASDVTDFATAAQGALADSAVQPAALASKQDAATLDADVAAKLDTPGSALQASADARIDSLAPRSVANPLPVGNAPHIQLGPIAKTAHHDGALVLQDDQATPSDDATRVCIIPRDHVYAGRGGVIKVFGDPWIDGESYRDIGLYFAADQANAGVFGDTGTHGHGVFWINQKRGSGTDGDPYAGQNPDIGFSFQDGETVAGRFAHISSGRPALVVGAGKPDIAKSASLTATRLEVQGDLGFNGTARKIRWYSTASTLDANGDIATQGTADNALTLDTNNVLLTLAGTRRLMVHSDGSVVMGDGTNRLATTTTAGFFYMRSMNGTPTGTPAVTSRAGTVPMTYDETNNKLMVYVPGQGWKGVVLS